MLAHELRNALAPISTAAEMLRLAATTDVCMRKASELITRQIKHMMSRRRPAMYAQGGEITLTVSPLTDRSDISIDLDIENKVLPHVFDLFSQAERTPDRTQRRLGIGPASVKPW
jgi:hypothetical protein